jgi:hypothetical protein
VVGKDIVVLSDHRVPTGAEALTRALRVAVRIEIVIADVGSCRAVAAAARIGQGAAIEP